ncbi:hypothetical protein Tco_0801612 [Tanacetum coccineum]|uniref:Uncharacterized protein n=1 Tax=Tanacetum coccineum TaxID=301880 RepID=A0ABQ4ZWI1_9ASTR
MRNRINLHIVCDDTLLGTLKFVSKTEDYQKYGALIPEEMINQTVKDSKAYKTYLDFATGKATPIKARKFKKIASPSQKLTPVLEEEPAKKPKRAKKPEPAKRAKMLRRLLLLRKGKDMDLLSDVALLEAAQLKKVLKKSKHDTHMLHESGSGDGVGSQPKVPDELQEKTSGTNKGTDSEADDDSNDDDNNDDDSDDVGDDKDILKSDDDQEEADDERT